MNRLLQQVGTGLAAVGTAWVGINQLIFNVDAGCRGVMFDRFRGVLDELDMKDYFLTFILNLLKDKKTWKLLEINFLKISLVVLPSITNEVSKAVYARLF